MMFEKNELEKKYTDAKSYYENGHLILAKEKFVDLIMQDPFTWEFWYSLGAIYQLEKNFIQAIASYNMAIVLNTNCAEIYFHLAECLLSMEDKKNALMTLDLAKKNCFDANLKDKILILKEQNSL